MASARVPTHSLVPPKVAVHLLPSSDAGLQGGCLSQEAPAHHSLAERGRSRGPALELSS